MVVIGFIDMKVMNYMLLKCMSWTLLEDKTSQTGVPKSMWIAVLLE